MKIAHIIREPRLAGAELLVVRLCREHLTAGLKPIVIATHTISKSSEPLFQELRGQGVDIHFPLRAFGRLARLRFIRKILNETTADIAFAHTVLPSLFARIAGMGLNIPIVSVLHAASEDYFGAVAAAERFAPKPASVVGVSHQNINWYRQRFGESIPLQHIPNGVDLNQFASSLSLREQVRAQLSILDKCTTVFLHAGRLASVKRQDLSIAAFDKISSARQNDSILLFAGLTEDPAMEAMVRDACKRNPRIRFLGARADISNIFAAADAILVPSDHEAHPLVAIEGLISQAALIISDIPAHRFAVGHEGVYLVRNVGEMAIAMEAVDRRRFIRDVNAFDIRRTARAYEALAHTLSTRGASESTVGQNRVTPTTFS